MWMSRQPIETEIMAHFNREKIRLSQQKIFKKNKINKNPKTTPNKTTCSSIKLALAD